ncbi:glycosyltransferase [Bosea sp. BIWAKO-01]|nr:glycosyltransferase [Bosea sp. BIWAKO-01]
MKLGGENLTALGDKARDARDWSAAVDHYSAHLRARPNDFGIWVQKGNCAKEARQFAVAFEAYQHAIGLNTTDSDVHLQLGHLFKMQGQRANALASYRKALELNPDGIEAFRELTQLGDKKRAELIVNRTAAETAQFVIDISDLIFYFRHHPRVSGIQRVQVELIRNFLRDWPDCGFVQMDPDGTLYALPSDSVSEFIELIDSSDRTVADLVEFTDKMHLGAAVFDSSKPRVYVLLGAFWVFPVIPQKMVELRSKGWKIVAYIYDLIPITHSEFCEKKLVNQFTTIFYTIAYAVDQILTISEHVKREVESKLRPLGLDIPVSAVPLAHEMKAVEEDVDGQEWLAENELDQPYVLCVGTIEVRKNHVLLFNVWRNLERARGEATPKLVLVGRAGWRVSDFMEQLEVTDFVSKRIVILNDLSDPQLVTLYRSAMFTVFPSFEEGWGLPVGESLVQGKLCLASSSSSIPEVGGDLVKYFDPYNAKAAQTLIEQYIDDENLRASDERCLKENFKPRRWSDVSRVFRDALQKRWSPETLSLESKRNPPELVEGQDYQVGTASLNLRRKEDLRARAIISCLVGDWNNGEAFGAWAKKSAARVCFRAAPGIKKVTVYLTLTLPGNIGSNEIAIRTAKATSNDPCRFFVRGHQPIAFECDVDEDGVVDFRIVTMGRYSDMPGDSRKLYCGLVALTYVRTDDVSARLRILERTIFQMGAGQSS